MNPNCMLNVIQEASISLLKLVTRLAEPKLHDVILTINTWYRKHKTNNFLSEYDFFKQNLALYS